MKLSKIKTAVITGASSGIGLSTAKEYLKNGYNVYSLSRSAPPDASIKHIKCDVTYTDETIEAVKQAASLSESIDVLILNAGFGISGAIENTNIEDAQKQFDVNFFGTLRALQPALPYLRKSKGTVIFVSSFAACTSIPFQAFYSATKSAILSLSRALSAEVRPFGIKVTSVLPGDVKTAFTDRRNKFPDTDNGVYNNRITRSVEKMEKDERNGMCPDTIAKKIYRISHKRRLRPYYGIGFGYKTLLLLARIFPPSLVDYVIRKLYCK